LAESKLVLSEHWAVAVEAGIRCSKCPLSGKESVIMNSVELTFFPCEGKIAKRYPGDSVKRGSSKSREYKHAHSLTFVFPALFYHFPLTHP